MEKTDKVPETIDEYVENFDEPVRTILSGLRSTIRDAAPDATEKISYGMPTFYLKGNLVHFAAFKKHIGLYPTPSGTERFAEELAGYETSKGAIRFPLDEPLPLDLVTRIVRFRAEENRLKKPVR